MPGTPLAAFTAVPRMLGNARTGVVPAGTRAALTAAGVPEYSRISGDAVAVLVVVALPDQRAHVEQPTVQLARR